MNSSMRVAIIGSTGYGGIELVRLLLQHPHVTITSVLSSSSAGIPLTEGYPHLSEIIFHTLDDINIHDLQQKADLVFLATPSGVSSSLAPSLLEAGLKVIDLSGDFRLKTPELYEKWYKKTPPQEKDLQKAVYGLAEINGQQVKDATFIANPGCYPTATLLGLFPVVKENWIDRKNIIIDAKSGVSGAGRGLGLSTHYSEMNENFLAYKVNKHQHIPEIEQIVSEWAEEEIIVTFTPHLVPMTRGILSTIYVMLKQNKTEDEVFELYRKYYGERRFVRIREKGKWPATKEVWGSNYCDIGLSYDDRTGRLTIISVIDNIVKGAAGQAVQNLNIMMGWEETAGLQFTPVYP